MKIVLLGNVASNNKVYSANRHERAKIARQVHDDVRILVIAALGQLPETPMPSPVAMHVATYAPNPKDPDNALKLLLDGLVFAGVIEGDGWKDIRPLSVISNSCPRDAARIELTITNDLQEWMQAVTQA
jgi:Holliday junction resolvase RusA-like endonuclease